MSFIINKIRLINYKKFQDYTFEPNERINILVGDNEAGKSSILEAIDLVIKGSIKHFETIGIDKLLNVDVIEKFKSGERNFENLPKMIIELYFNECHDDFFNGVNNLDRKECDGIRLRCIPNDDYITEINESLKNNANYFPFDFYTVKFTTFADAPYMGHKKRLNTIFIDSSNANSLYATNDFVSKMYNQFTEECIDERIIHKLKYREMRLQYQKDALTELNKRIMANRNYLFGLKNGSYADLESDLMIYENNVGLDNRGTGMKSFIKTEFALERSKNNNCIVLIEEPENHLSPIKLRQLIKKILSLKEGQIFITTHNSLISTRLELRNLFIMGYRNINKPISLKNLRTETAEYFMKVPPAGIIEFSLSDKVILVEGPSEYMLMDKFYKNCTGVSPEEDNVQIITVRGLSFKRYLEVAKISGCKVAVITDNDGNYQKYCVDKYKGIEDGKQIKIFYEKENKKNTFEVVFYYDNESLCDKLFDSKGYDYMINNKTESAYRILSQDEDIKVPNYINGAIKWIKE